MWVKFLCVSALAGVVCCGSVPYYGGLDNDRDIESPSLNSGEKSPFPYYELPCMGRGGLCLQENECPEGKQVGEKGLCPMQQEQGVECCYSVGKSSTSCRSNGGECMSLHTNCGPNMTFARASDCHENEKCCILVH